MKNYIKRFVFFMLILLLILIIISYVFIPKNNTSGFKDKDSQAVGIYAEKKNSIDMIMYGDSEAFASTMPMRLWENYGYVSYVCATSGQTLPDTCKLAYESLKNQNPKLIVLEADNIFNSVSITVPMARVVNILLPITEHHNRWKELKKEDFFGKINYTDININKGYYYVGKVDPADTNGYMTPTDEIEEVPLYSKVYIKLLKKYSEAKGAKFIIVSVPHVRNWSYAKYNGVKEFAKKENIDFYDMNERKDELNINWNTETGDLGEHVNYWGAIKATDYLGKIIKENNLLESHKDDKEYSEWDKYLEEFNSRYPQN